MNNAIWKGERISALEVAEKFEVEYEVRKASGRKELLCPDPECKSPILRYCHGEIKDAYFAHLYDSNCDYNIFDKASSHLRPVINLLYAHFVSLGYKVQLDVKLINHHYTHMVIELSDKKIAIELGSQHISANQIQFLSDKYEKIGIENKWIVVGSTDFVVEENRLYFLKRYIINTSKNKDLIVISPNGTEVWQYKIDNKTYQFDNGIISVPGYSANFSYKSCINELRIVDGELTLKSFSNEYASWENKKLDAFNEFVRELKQQQDENKKREIQLERERQNLINNLKRKQTVPAETKKVAWFANEGTISTSAKTYEERKTEALASMQQGEVARDSTKKRWRKCVLCGKFDIDDEFAVTGGEYGKNGGKCKKCMP